MCYVEYIHKSPHEIRLIIKEKSQGLHRAYAASHGPLLIYL